MPTQSRHLNSWRLFTFVAALLLAPYGVAASDGKPPSAMDVLDKVQERYVSLTSFSSDLECVTHVVDDFRITFTGKLLLSTGESDKWRLELWRKTDATQELVALQAANGSRQWWFEQTRNRVLSSPFDAAHEKSAARFLPGVTGYDEKSASLVGITEGIATIRLGLQRDVGLAALFSPPQPDQPWEQLLAHIDLGTHLITRMEFRDRTDTQRFSVVFSNTQIAAAPPPEAFDWPPLTAPTPTLEEGKGTAPKDFLHFLKDAYECGMRAAQNEDEKIRAQNVGGVPLFYSWENGSYTHRSCVFPFYLRHRNANTRETSTFVLPLLSSLTSGENSCAVEILPLLSAWRLQDAGDFHSFSFSCPLLGTSCEEEYAPVDNFSCNDMMLFFTILSERRTNTASSNTWCSLPLLTAVTRLHDKSKASEMIGLVSLPLLTCWGKGQEGSRQFSALGSLPLLTVMLEMGDLNKCDTVFGGICGPWYWWQQKSGSAETRSWGIPLLMDLTLNSETTSELGAHHFRILYGLLFEDEGDDRAGRHTTAFSPLLKIEDGPQERLVNVLGLFHL